MHRFAIRSNVFVVHLLGPRHDPSHEAQAIAGTVPPKAPRRGTGCSSLDGRARDCRRRHCFCHDLQRANGSRHVVDEDADARLQLRPSHIADEVAAIVGCGRADALKRRDNGREPVGSRRSDAAVPEARQTTRGRTDPSVRKVNRCRVLIASADSAGQHSPSIGGREQSCLCGHSPQSSNL